ncbi:DUF934 domain-containing protein [Rubrimonas cliftonensis]|uniref:DUF934 domain-containing protein n=1 Tax=Rubrimonas cliftonensis TaxID=89524 RepID=A0A1H4BYI3_9RHOB|nr:DUF934 domain-containing protein [Rubrimonas cliftonensis]SEA53149.1 protein of unknown function [Rubrimonas cliftonensis]
MLVVTDDAIAEDAAPLSAPQDAPAEGPLRLALPNDADLAALAPLLARASLVAVVFPGFSDGRGFSLARRLRAAEYRGRLRAVGALIPDQFAYARACGFDEVGLTPALLARQGEGAWAAASRTPAPPMARRRAG